MLQLQTHIIQRIIDQVPGFTTVANPSVLAGLQDIGLLLPACIVRPGAGAPTDGSGIKIRQPFLEEQDWDVVIIVAHQATDDQNGLTEQVAGGYMAGIVQSLHDWQPGIPKLQHQPIRYAGRDVPFYSKGYAEFTLTFTAKALIGA